MGRNNATLGFRLLAVGVGVYLGVSQLLPYLVALLPRSIFLFYSLPLYLLLPLHPLFYTLLLYVYQILQD